MSTFTPTDDRLDLFGRVDLAAEFLAAGMTQGRNRQWTCPNPQHAQTGATPPVSIGGPNGNHLWKCHGCGVGGSVVDLYCLMRGIDTAAAFALVREKVGTPGYRPPPPRPTVQPVTPPDADRGRLDPAHSAEVVEDYLTRRNWNDNAAEAFGLYGVRGRFGHPRVRHPYRVAGEVRWWQDRAVYEADTGPKWDNPKNLARMPYAIDLATAFDLAEAADPPSILVAEGAADVVAVWHTGDVTCIGIPGTEGVDQWVPALAGLDVMIATDPDDAGDRAANDLAVGIHAAGGRSKRLRPPVDLADWLDKTCPDGLADGLRLLANRADWWTP